jgi:hypothetical protein
MGTSSKRKSQKTHSSKKRQKSKTPPSPPKKRSRARTPPANFPMIGYEDDQQVKRNMVIMPVFSWETTHTAFFQTSGRSNERHDVYAGTWMPTTGCLKRPVDEFGTGHIVKIGYVNKIHLPVIPPPDPKMVPPVKIPVWLPVWMAHIRSAPEYATLNPLLQKTLHLMQTDIVFMKKPELETLIKCIKQHDHAFRLVQSYFLTWQQLQISAQISDTGFWQMYPDFREFVLSHNWVEDAFVERTTILPRIRLGVPSVYVGYREVNSFLAQHHAYLDANVTLHHFVKPIRREDNTLFYSIDALHAYIENRAIVLKMVQPGERIF